MVTAAKNSGHVLIVEDDEESRELLGLVLTIRGYGVTTAANGVEAWRVLRSRVRPDLILLDQAMPVMDGSEFRAGLIGDPAFRSIPVIIISGSAVPAAMSSGTVGVLQKPVDVDVLLRLVRHYLTIEDAGTVS